MVLRGNKNGERGSREDGGREKKGTEHPDETA